MAVDEAEKHGGVVVVGLGGFVGEKHPLGLVDGVHRNGEALAKPRNLLGAGTKPEGVVLLLRADTVQAVAEDAVEPRMRHLQRPPQQLLQALALAVGFDDEVKHASALTPVPLLVPHFSIEVQGKGSLHADLLQWHPRLSDLMELDPNLDWNDDPTRDVAF
jgi:hypothetical protein